MLYRTPAKWRWMVVDDKGGMLDGALPHTPSSAGVEEAQQEFLANLAKAEGSTWTAVWEPADKPDWWNGELESSDP